MEESGKIPVSIPWAKDEIEDRQGDEWIDSRIDPITGLPDDLIQDKEQTREKTRERTSGKTEDRQEARLSTDCQGDKSTDMQGNRPGQVRKQRYRRKGNGLTNSIDRK